MSCQSYDSANGYKKILNRKFKIERDLTKYSKELSFSQTARKVDMFNKTRKGKNLAGERKRAELMVGWETRHNRERDIMKTMDWSDSDLFDVYTESRKLRKPIEQVLKRYATLRTVNGDKIYTDVELQYFM